MCSWPDLYAEFVSGTNHDDLGQESECFTHSRATIPTLVDVFRLALWVVRSPTIAAGAHDIAPSGGPGIICGGLGTA
jgi:hypothetical protein